MPPTFSCRTMSNLDSSLFLLGSSHRTAPLEIRERLAIVPEQMQGIYAELAKLDHLREFLVLNTCNRVELYGVSEHPEIRKNLEAVFCSFHHFENEFLNRYSFWETGFEVVKHLFEISAGLDSQMLGETEIFGQVKESYVQAVDRASVGRILHRIFQKSFQTSKWVRTHTAINRGKTSIGNVAVDLALRIFGSLEECRILLLGSGQVAESTAKSLKNRGAGTLSVCSRSAGRAEELAGKIEGRAVSFEKFEEIFSEQDILICSTAASERVVSVEAVQKAMSERPGRPLFLIDLAVPRDIDTGAAEVSNVYLYNLDDLAEIARENRKIREAEIEECSLIITSRARHLWDQIN